MFNKMIDIFVLRQNETLAEIGNGSPFSFRSEESNVEMYGYPNDNVTSSYKINFTTIDTDVDMDQKKPPKLRKLSVT